MANIIVGKVPTRLPTLDNHIATTLFAITPTRLPTLVNHITPTRMPTLDNHSAPTLLPLMPTRMPTLLLIMHTLNFDRANLMAHNHNLCKYSKCYLSEVIKDEKFNEGN